MTSEWPFGIAPENNPLIHDRGSQWGFPKLVFLNIRPPVLGIYIKRSSVRLMAIWLINPFLEHNGWYM